MRLNILAPKQGGKVTVRSFQADNQNSTQLYPMALYESSSSSHVKAILPVLGFRHEKRMKFWLVERDD